MRRKRESLASSKAGPSKPQSSTRTSLEPPADLNEPRQQSDDGFIPDGDNQPESNTAGFSSTGPWLQLFIAHKNDVNKENIRQRSPTKKPSLMNPQANARRLEWDSDGDDGEPGPSNRAPVSNNKRTREEYNQPSEDESGFQVDRRNIESRRQVAEPPAKRRSPPPRQLQRPTRLSIEIDSGSESESEGSRIRRHNARNADAVLQDSARRSLEEQVEEIGEEDDIPPPTAREVKQLAEKVSKIAKGYRTQTRILWSLRDEEALKQAIVKYGPHYSVIEAEVAFERDVDQVALKDKARNMKVAYLK